MTDFIGTNITYCRPHFGEKQVRSPEDIVLGDFYVSRNVKYNAKFIHQIISIDEQDYIAAWHIIDAYGKHVLFANERYSLHDCSILPYIAGSGSLLWNAGNFLEHLADAKTPEEAFALVGKV